MVVVVSGIFSVCWLADGVIYMLSFYSTVSDVIIIIAYMLILFNSSINPFVYALVNERFREKMKAMICCKCRPGNVVQTEVNGRSASSTHPTQ